MSIKDLKIGDRAPEIVNAVIEIVRGTGAKYEYSEAQDVIVLNRTLDTNIQYVTDYGFIPGTRSGDGDHLDIMVLTTKKTSTGTVVEVRPVALLRMTDNGSQDFKILGVDIKDSNYERISNLSDLPCFDPGLQDKISDFFAKYKKSENKMVKILGWEDRAQAINEIKKSVQIFEKIQ